MANEKRLIDAEPIKKFIVDGLNNPDLKKAFGHDAIEILTEIEYAPTVDAVEVVHGRWEAVDHDGSWRVDKCSACHKRMHYVDYDQPYAYCPNCGARMDGDGNA